MQKTRWLLATVVVSLSLLLTATLLKSLIPTQSQSSRGVLPTLANRLVISRDAHMNFFSAVINSIPSLASLQNGTIFTSKELDVQVAGDPVYIPLPKIDQISKEKSLRGTIGGSTADVLSKAIPILNLSIRLLEDNSTSEASSEASLSPVVIPEINAPVDNQVLIIEEVDTSRVDDTGSPAKLSIPEQSPALPLISDSTPLNISEESINEGDMSAKSVQSESSINPEQTEATLTTALLPVPSDSVIEELTISKTADVVIDEVNDSTRDQPPVFVSLLPLGKTEESSLSDAAKTDVEATNTTNVNVIPLDVLPQPESDLPSSAATDSITAPAPVAPGIELMPLVEEALPVESKQTGSDSTTVTRDADAEEHYTYRDESSDTTNEIFETASQFFKSFMGKNLAAIFSQEPRVDPNEVNAEQII